MILTNGFKPFLSRRNQFAIQSIKMMVSESKPSTASRIKVKKIIESDDSVIGKAVIVKGWVRTVRDQKKFSFIEINDGSNLSGIQAVAEAEISSYGEVSKLSTGKANFNEMVSML
jgi:aspartyl/asparaginyl-tRNA synthetase